MFEAQEAKDKAQLQAQAWHLDMLMHPEKYPTTEEREKALKLLTVNKD